MRLALSQLNPTVGDLAGNEAAIRDGIARAKAAGAQLVAFPELAITGYPPEDLLLKEHFLRDARATVDRLAQDADGIVVLVGVNIALLAGSLVLGFLDLQSSQAQNRFYTELEDWLSTTVYDHAAEPGAQVALGHPLPPAAL